MLRGVALDRTRSAHDLGGAGACLLDSWALSTVGATAFPAVSDFCWSSEIEPLTTVFALGISEDARLTLSFDGRRPFGA